MNAYLCMHACMHTHIKYMFIILFKYISMPKNPPQYNVKLKEIPNLQGCLVHMKLKYIPEKELGNRH
jgi:hypothetical protein